MLNEVHFKAGINNRYQSYLLLLIVALCSVSLAGCIGVTGGKSGPTPAVSISSALANVPTTTGFHVGWTTNVPATSQVEFGMTAAYGSTTQNDPSLVTNHQQILTGLKIGTLYHFRVHSTDADGNAAVGSDMTFATTGDTTPPNVSISSPAAGATLSGISTIVANASDNAGIASVQFKVDSANAGAAVTSAPYTYALNTNALSNGNHILSAVATDTAGNSATSALVAVKVNNSGSGAPSVSITSPANGATVSSIVTVSANASGNAGIASVQFQLDGANVGSLDTTAPYTYSWDTTKSSKGQHILLAIARDAAGNVATSTGVIVTVNNSSTDTTPPTVSMLAPANGSTVSGTVVLSATASDNVAVASVQFQLDGANVGPLDTTAPYAYSWDTTKAANGSHTLTAIATDTSGNSATSSGVSVSVKNSSVDTTPPSVPAGLQATAASSSQINLSWQASTDNVGVTGYVIYRGGARITTTGTTSYLDNGLSPATSYTYTVAAYDAAGNTSAQSSGASATTMSQSGSGGIPTTIGWYEVPNSQMNPVCPNLPQINGATGCAAVISAWNSGLADTKRNRLVFFGGGHADYAGNEVYSLDLNTLSTTRLTNPSLPAVECVSGLINQVAPNSRHTYGGVSYIPTSDQAFLFGGNVWRGTTGCQPSIDPLYVGYAGRLSDTWTLDLNALSWTRRDPLATASRPVYGISGLGEGIVSDYDPVTDRVIVSDNVNWYSFDQTANAYTQLNSGYQHINYLQNGVIDPVRRIFFTFGGNQIFAYDLTTNKIAEWTSQVSGCDGIVTNNYPGLAYDTIQKKIVGWAGGNTVYVFDPDAKSCQAQTFPNGPGVQQTPDGTFGRFRYFPTLGVFALVNDYKQNAFVLRLTPANGGGPSSGPVISSVSTTGITTATFTTNWTTNVASTSQVDYGTTTNYGNSTALNSSQVTSHAVGLTGLQSGTLYHFRVRSKNADGTESISGDFAVSTNSTTDTTPPTVALTSPASGATVSGSVTLAANATDNVGVAGVQFLVDGNNAGPELTSAPYTLAWDTTTTSNGSHSIVARARDAAGNTATSTAATITISNSSQNGGSADFQTRCAAPGVTLCQGFDNPADFAQNKYLYANWQGVFKGTMDTSNTASGAGSLKFEIDPFSAANVSGNWTQSFGQDFGEGTTFYLQFRQMFSDTMLTNNWGDPSGNTSWKQAIFHKSGHTCTDVELTTVQHNLDGLPIMYTDCGSRGLYTNGGTPPYLLQQGDYNCSWGTKYATNPNCFSYAPNVWITFYYKVTIGHWGQTDSTIEAWAGLPGQPLKQWIKMPNFMLDNGSPGNDYNTVTLLPYMTGKDATLNHPVAYTWYDELIVSSQPIAAPK